MGRSFRAFWALFFGFQETWFGGCRAGGSEALNPIPKPLGFSSVVVSCWRCLGWSWSSGHYGRFAGLGLRV